MSKIVDAGLYSRELTALLMAAGERGPFVVVGHSFGGLIARAFLRDNPGRVRGLLLAESVTPNDPTSGPFWSEAGHRVDMAASSAATGGGPPLGRLHLLVLSASDPEGDHLGQVRRSAAADVGEALEEGRREDMHVAGEHDQGNTTILEPVGHRAIAIRSIRVALQLEDGSFDPGLLSALERLHARCVRADTDDR